MTLYITSVQNDSLFIYTPFDLNAYVFIALLSFFYLNL